LNGSTLQFYLMQEDTSSEYVGHGLVSRSWVQGQGHGSEKALQLKNKWSEIALA